MKKFVAINYIECEETYIERFETLFANRAHAIDRVEGFIDMEVLKPNDGSAYLVVSHWNSEDAFKNWMRSPEFLEGRKRGFEDVKKAREAGVKPPMTSTFKTYSVVAK